MNSWFRAWQLTPCCVTICHTFKWTLNSIIFYFTLFYKWTVGFVCDNLPHVVWHNATLSNENVMIFYSILLYSTQMNSWFCVRQLPTCCVTIYTTLSNKHFFLFYFTLFYTNEQLVSCVTTYPMCVTICHTFKLTFHFINSSFYSFYSILFYSIILYSTQINSWFVCDNFPHVVWQYATLSN